MIMMNDVILGTIKDRFAKAKLLQQKQEEERLIKVRNNGRHCMDILLLVWLLKWYNINNLSVSTCLSSSLHHYCTYLLIYLSYLSIHLTIYLSIHLSIISIYTFNYLPIYLTTYLSYLSNLSIYLYIYLSHLSINQCIIYDICIGEKSKVNIPTIVITQR